MLQLITTKKMLLYFKKREYMKLKRLLAIVLSVMMAGSLMVACGNGADAPVADEVEDVVEDVVEPDADEDDGDEVMEVEPGALGTLEFWTMLTGADGVSMTAIVEAFNATNPDFTVVHRPMEAADLYINFPLAVQSQEGVPDIALNHVERIPVFQENDFFY